MEGEIGSSRINPGASIKEGGDGIGTAKGVGDL